MTTDEERSSDRKSVVNRTGVSSVSRSLEHGSLAAAEAGVEFRLNHQVVSVEAELQRRLEGSFIECDPHAENVVLDPRSASRDLRMVRDAEEFADAVRECSSAPLPRIEADRRSLRSVFRSGLELRGIAFEVENDLLDSEIVRFEAVGLSGDLLLSGCARRVGL